MDESLKVSVKLTSVALCNDDPHIISEDAGEEPVWWSYYKQRRLSGELVLLWQFMYHLCAFAIICGRM